MIPLRDANPSILPEKRLSVPYRYGPISHSTTLATRVQRVAIGSILVLVMMLGACTTAEFTDEPALPTTVGSIPPSEQSEDHTGTEPSGTKTVHTNLAPELLYDLLLASVANQREQPETALEALVRAAYQSRDSEVTVQAILLALRLHDSLQAIELSRLLLDLKPDDPDAMILLATAQIDGQLVDFAADTLLELIETQDIDNEDVLQEVAELIVRQPESPRTQLRSRLEQAVEGGNLMVLYTTALVAFQLDEAERANALLERVLDQQPRWETAAILKLLYLAESAPEELDTWAKEFLRSEPAAERFQIRLGQVLLQKERLDDALAQFNAVLDLNPDSADALFAAAVIYMEREEVEPAERLFLHYLEHHTREGDQARIYLAQLLEDQERYQEASTLLRQVESYPYYLEAQIMLSGILAEKKGVEAGLSSLRGITAHNEPDAVRLILEQSILLRDFDLMERSLALLTEALVARPEHPQLLYSRGLLAAQMERIGIVEEDMRRLIQLQPDNAHAYNALGYTLADITDRYDEASELLIRALEIRPEDPYILDSMGWLLYRTGNLDQSLEYLEKAWGYMKDSEIAAHLGEVLWQLGRRSEAKKIWQQGQQSDPDNTTLLETMGRFLGTPSDRPSIRSQSTEYQFPGALYPA